MPIIYSLINFLKCIDLFIFKKNRIHADLNSKNIVFKKRPNDTGEMKTSILKIIDFSDERETKGTPTHMAPELILDYKEMPTYKSDIYSAAVVFWEMLSLESPFVGLRSKQVKNFHIEGGMLQMNEDWPQSIKEILGKCLSRNPRERPSFSDIVATLEKIREEFPYEDDDDDEECDGYDDEENDEHDNDDDDNDPSSNVSQADGAQAPIPSSLFSS